VGWAWQEEEGYEVVGHVTGYPTACFRKLSDEIHPLPSFRGVFFDFSTLNESGVPDGVGRGLGFG
jgi:hypothetical protein